MFLQPCKHYNMPSEIKHFPVNWVDGMKISKSHLLSFQHSIDDQIRDSISTSHTSLNFGLLPYGKNSNDLQINVDQAGNIHITLKTCIGITPNGCRIQILEDMPLSLHIPSNELLSGNNIAFSDEAMFYITLTVNPFKRIPFGDPLENELPPRNPFTSPEYRLDLLLSTQVNLNQFESSSLIVGKLSYKKGEFKHHQEFIPASTSLQCHPNLIEFYNAAGDALIQIERSCFLILQKIRLKDQKTSLSTVSTCFQRNWVLIFLQDYCSTRPLFRASLPFIFLYYCSRFPIQSAQFLHFLHQRKEKNCLPTWANGQIFLQEVSKPGQMIF